MALNIETFSNRHGGNAFFKAVGHPLIARKVPAFLAGLGDGPVALYDPYGLAAGFAELYDLSPVSLAGVYVQDLDDLGRSVLGCTTQPVTDLPASGATRVLVAAFDAERAIGQIRHLVPAQAEVHSFDALRLPADMVTSEGLYLAGINFATNFAFFRDQDGQHTRLTTVDYWSAYGARNPQAWCCLFDGDGAVLAEWREDLPGANALFSVDSAEVRRRFGLPEFTGQLFVHVVGAAGHDIVKYALDTYGDTADVLSATHDANAWPSDLYAGLPAPADGETVILWVQNSHPVPIPAGTVGLGLMGSDEVAHLDQPVPAFGSTRLETTQLLPEARWPHQFEVQAGKYFVRPRYEVVSPAGRRRIAHVNVERSDLEPDPRIPDLANLMGKGFILPAPLLPLARYRSRALPTPMSTCQQALPIKLLVYAADGRELLAKPIGLATRGAIGEIDLDAVLADAGIDLNGSSEAAGEASWGHMELAYDFSQGGSADGWLHAIFRYQDRLSGHGAETSFGAHVFNSVLTYKNEPQSYSGRAPGLSTRLLLRLGPPPLDTLCHLIYPASTPWHGASSTELQLHARDGREIARHRVEIPCSGSLLWRVSETFSAAELAGAESGYVVVRDTTCRLFGYHGLINGEESFSLDHMFGF